MALLNNGVGQANDFNVGTISDGELLCMVIHDAPSYTVAPVQPIDMMDAAKTGVGDMQCDGVQDDTVAILDPEDCVLDDTSLLFS